MAIHNTRIGPVLHQRDARVLMAVPHCPLQRGAFQLPTLGVHLHTLLDQVLAHLALPIDGGPVQRGDVLIVSPLEVSTTLNRLDDLFHVTSLAKLDRVKRNRQRGGIAWRVSVRAGWQGAVSRLLGGSKAPSSACRTTTQAPTQPRPQLQRSGLKAPS